MAGSAREPPIPSAAHSPSVQARRELDEPLQTAQSTSLRPGRFCLLCPKANKNDISALFGSLSSSLTLRGSFGGRGSRIGERKSTSGGSLARIAALVGSDTSEEGGVRDHSQSGQAGQGSHGSHGSQETVGGHGDGKNVKRRSLSPQKSAASNPPLVATNSLTVNSWNQAPHTWHLGHGSAAVVNFGMFEVTSGINRVQPSVFFDGSDEPCLCVFQGYLSNLEELMDRYMPHLGGGGLTKPKKSPGERAAALLYTMFWSDDRNAEDPLMVLSELQGQYAFVMYNGDRKQVFAARDSSGKERLYFELDDENGVTVSNAKDLRVRSVDGMGWVVFEELQPGHYMCGRPVKVNQFALTREEMKEREEFLEGGGLAGLSLEL